MKRKKKKASAHKIRMFFAFLIFGGIIATLGYNLFCNLVTIKEMNIEKKELKNIAKYVREKYFYSKDGELILRIED